MLSFIRIFFKPDRPLRIALHGILGFYPNDMEPYKLALKHRGGAESDNNERLEFLGDAVLSAVVADVLYRRFRTQQEGFLTAARSRIVSRESLNRISHEIGLDRLIRNVQRGHVDGTNLPGNTLEALMGAVYLDMGYQGCLRFVQGRLLHRVVNIDDVAQTDRNYKSQLLEFCQKRHLKLEYRIEPCVDQEGSPAFRAVALVAEKERGTGVGASKKAAAQLAAAKALQGFARRRKPQKAADGQSAGEKTEKNEK